jgi:hypothetical protein
VSEEGKNISLLPLRLYLTITGLRKGSTTISISIAYHVLSWYISTNLSIMLNSLLSMRIISVINSIIDNFENQLFSMRCYCLVGLVIMFIKLMVSILTSLCHLRDSAAGHLVSIKNI